MNAKGKTENHEGLTELIFLVRVFFQVVGICLVYGASFADETVDLDNNENAYSAKADSKAITSETENVVREEVNTEDAMREEVNTEDAVREEVNTDDEVIEEFAR
ncbi:hypothetical protein OTU49_006311 [Cherax quadricarinatus]|uniref:Uncharacterized protein n=1 Tax=Cherax quadricarinatus TaxID=27406 RepID=A0AAW0X316_CHEQU